MTRPLTVVVKACAISLAVTPLILCGSPCGSSVARAQDLQPPPPMTPGAPSPPRSYGPAPGAPAAGTTGSTAPVSSKDDSADSGLGLEWVWLNADVGFSSTSMNAIDTGTLALKKTSSDGPAFGLGAGVRLLFFTAGVRVRDLQLSDFNVWEVDAEAAFHVRIDRIDPYLGLRGGYAFVGTLSSDAVNTTAGGSASDVSVHGVNAGLMFGLDYYINHLLSVGVDGNPEFLFLQRPPVALPKGVDASTLTKEQQALYKQSGSSIGFGFVGTAHLGVHF